MTENIRQAAAGSFTVGAASIKSDNTNEDNVPAISDSPVILEDYELTYAMAIDSEGTQIDLLKQEHGSEHLHLYKHVEFVTTERTATYGLPFTKTVKQGGSVAPGQETFSLEIFDIGNGNANEYKDVTYTASVKTNGAGDYEGVLTITGPASQVRQMVSEGFFVREVKGSAANWTYSDAVWRVDRVSVRTKPPCKCIRRGWNSRTTVTSMSGMKTTLRRRWPSRTSIPLMTPLLPRAFPSPRR